MVKKLLERVYIGNKEARNRIVMPPMETRLSTIYGDITPAMIDYYEERAKGGTGTIIVENTYVDNLASRSSLSSSGLYSDHLIAGKNLLAETIKTNGALAILQLSHGGRQARPGATEYEPVAPSAVISNAINVMPRVLAKKEIISIEDAFAEAAFRAQAADFDGVEIHGAHGYLIGSFLSPLTNLRKDEYGGNLEKRSRFASNIIKKARKKTGKDFIIGYRISASEYINGGLEPEEACSFVNSIQEDIDYIHVSAGIYDSPSFWTIAPIYEPRGQLLPLARQMKKSVDIPVIAVGSIDPETAEQVLEKGEADLIALGRALIADPYLPDKLKDGRIGDIRPCLRGNEGCISRFHTGSAIRCEVNPSCGQESKFNIKKVSTPKKILVAGGGVSGMEAARVASLMGHKVTIMEKENCLGGHMIESALQTFKTEEAELLEWLINQVQKSDIKIELNKTVTTDIVTLKNPDFLILAIGSEYSYPPIKGAENAILAGDVLKDNSLAGEKVVIVGGGLIGAETGLTLAAANRDVTILEMTDQIVTKLEPDTRQSMIQRLEAENVNVLTGQTVIEIGNGVVIAEDSGNNPAPMKADTAVMATGLVSRDVSKLKGIIPDTICIGDCIEARKIYHCIHEAWHAVFNNLSE